jgi:hypothetical protein
MLRVFPICHCRGKYWRWRNRTDHGAASLIFRALSAGIFGCRLGYAAPNRVDINTFLQYFTILVIAGGLGKGEEYSIILYGVV